MIRLQNVLGRLISSSRSSATTEAEEEVISRLLRLPTEIILMVASMLPSPSAACFALCNRHLNHILGPRFLRLLRIEDSDVMLAFLSSVAKDLPQYFVCQECTRLHLLSAISWPRVINTRNCGPRCTRRSSSFRLIFFSPYEICFPHIQLAMEKYHCGSDVRFPLEAFQYLEVEWDQTKEETTLLSVDPQIVAGELLMRAQTWTLLPWNRRDEFVKELATKHLSFGFCMHTRLGPLRKNLVSDLVRSRLDRLEAGEGCRTQTLQCPYCWMDYVLDAIDFGERGFAILATRWVNLGAGLDAADAKWRSHMSLPERRNALRTPSPGHLHPIGNIRASFEAQAELSFEELAADNKLKLFSKREKRLVCRGSDGIVWKWDRGKRWYIAPYGPPERSFWDILMG